MADRGGGFDPQGRGPAGFGLSGIRERAGFLGGDLQVGSAPGRGSRFTLTVPLGGLIRPIPPAAAAAEVRVLLVDDHRLMRQGLMHLPQSQPGILVAGEASGGAEAGADAFASKDGKYELLIAAIHGAEGRSTT